MKLYNVKVKVEQEGKVSKKGIQAEPKTVTEAYSVWAVSVTDAEVSTHEYMKGTMQDYEVASVTETKILDVIGVKK